MCKYFSSASHAKLSSGISVCSFSSYIQCFNSVWIMWMDCFSAVTLRLVLITEPVEHEKQNGQSLENLIESSTLSPPWISFFCSLHTMAQSIKLLCNVSVGIWLLAVCMNWLVFPYILYVWDLSVFLLQWQKQDTVYILYNQQYKNGFTATVNNICSSAFSLKTYHMFFCEYKSPGLL